VDDPIEPRSVFGMTYFHFQQFNFISNGKFVSCNNQPLVFLAGLRDVRDGLSVQGIIAGIYGPLGTTDQEDQARLARASKQCQQETIRDVQEGSVRSLHARSAENDEERQLTKGLSRISLT